MFELLLNHYVEAINVFLVGLLVILLGASAIDTYKIRSADEALPSALGRPKARAPQSLSKLRPRSYYDTIVQRDIFNLVPAPEPPIENEDLHITLLGTSHLTTSRPFAIIEDQAGHQSLFQQGDAIPGIGRVLEVGQDQMVILHNGHLVKSEIPSDQAKSSDVSAAAPSNFAIIGGKRFRMPGF